MAIGISSTLLAAIVADAAGAPGREVCGLLWGDAHPAHDPVSPFRPEPVEGRASSGGARDTSFDCAQDERILAVAPTANVAADPARAFEVDPAALFAAIRAERAGGRRILGHYHSHPNGSTEPSARDAAMADRPGRLWLIVADGAVVAWREMPGGPVQGAFQPVRLLVEG